MNLQFDQTTWNCSGPGAKTFKSYFGFLAWSYCSILKDEWKDIEKDVKDKIWDDLKVF
jgi:hypothetical protein